MSAPAYQLTSEAEHLIDMRYDISAMPFEGIERMWFASTSPLTTQEPLQFVGNFTALRGRDYPVCKPATWPVMSRRMLDVLRAVGPFDHRILRCLVFDDTVPPDERIDASGQWRRDVVDERFVAVQLTAHTDALDWDRSAYERDDAQSDVLADLTTFVLRKDVALPPLFRIAPYPRVLLISAAAKNALEAAGIVGLSLRPYNFGME